MPDVEVYMIANLSVNDAEEYRKYEKGFFPILKRFGGEFVTFDDSHETFEGTDPLVGRVIILSSHQRGRQETGTMIQTINLFQNFVG